MAYLLGIDLGTSGLKSVLFDQSGDAVAAATWEYPMYQPQNGWAEQDPNDWWNACAGSVRDVLSKSGIDPKNIAGIGFSGQMHGLVMMDENGNAIGNSILWCDGRTEKECREITEIIGAQRLIDISANPALTGFTAGKILWVRANEPERYKKCRQVLLPKDFLRYRLTGKYAAEVSDASGTNLFDVAKRKWSNEIIEALEIERAWFPEVYESSEVAGKVSAEAAKLTGLAEGTPVVCGAGDNAAAAVGSGIVSKGKAFISIGTSGVIFAHSDNVTIDPKGRVHTFCSAVPGAWTVMSCTLAAGGSLQWFRNQFCGAEMQVAEGMKTDPYVLMDQQAASIPIGAERLLFLPYLMGERSPLLDPSARGVFFGLSGMHTRQHLLRAVMEGVAYSQKQCIDILREMGVVSKQLTATGGGGKSPLWRQMIADVIGCPIVTVKNAEGPALGAAILAGVGTGIYRSVTSACDSIIKMNTAQQPIDENVKKYAPYYQLYTGLYPDLKEKFGSLAAIG